MSNDICPLFYPVKELTEKHQLAINRMGWSQSIALKETRQSECIKLHFVREGVRLNRDEIVEKRFREKNENLPDMVAQVLISLDDRFGRSRHIDLKNTFT